MQLILEKPDGTRENLTSIVTLDREPGYFVEAQDNTIDISMNPVLVESLPELATKYEDVLAGGTGTSQGVAYTFEVEWNGASGFGKYGIVSLATSRPVDGNMFLLGSECSQIGLFQSVDGPGINPGFGRGDSINNAGLHVFDVCPPCLDCDDYTQIQEYLQELINALNNFATRIMAVPDPTWFTGANKNSTPYGLYKQHKALTYYWDYLSHQSTISLDVFLEDGRYPAVFIARTSYVNYGNTSVDPVVDIIIQKWEEVEPESWEWVVIEGGSTYIRVYPGSLATAPGHPIPPRATKEYRREANIGSVSVGDRYRASVTWTGMHFGEPVTFTREVYAFRAVDE